jgi:hypothetical protein
VRLDDLPAGWTPGPAPDGGSGFMEVFAACVGAPHDLDDVIAEEWSPIYTDASGNSLFSWAGRFRSQERVDDDTALFGDPKASECFARALPAGLDEESTPADVIWGTPDAVVEPGRGTGPAGVVGTATARIPLQMATGEGTTLVLQYVFLAGRSTEAIVSFGGYEEMLPSGLREDAVAAIAERLASL